MRNLWLTGAVASAVIAVSAASGIADPGPALQVPPAPAEVAPLRPLSEVGLLAVMREPPIVPAPHRDPRPHPPLPGAQNCAIDLKRCSQEPRVCLATVERCSSVPCAVLLDGSSGPARAGPDCLAYSPGSYLNEMARRTR